MIERVRRQLALVRQLFGSRGVQSPSVYRILSDVICNRQAYYAYTDLAAHLRRKKRTDRKIAKLLLRLSNYVRADAAILPQDSQCFALFVVRGCKHTSIFDSQFSIINYQKNSVLILTAADQLPQSLQPLREGSALMVQNIYCDRASLQSWRQLAAQPWATLTLDLGLAGVVLTSTAYSKQHYIINL